MTWRWNLHQATSLAKSQKTLEADGSKLWVTKLSIIPHTLGILTAKITYCITLLDYINVSQINRHDVDFPQTFHTLADLPVEENAYWIPSETISIDTMHSMTQRIQLFQLALFPTTASLIAYICCIRMLYLNATLFLKCNCFRYDNTCQVNFMCFSWQFA